MREPRYVFVGKTRDLRDVAGDWRRNHRRNQLQAKIGAWSVIDLGFGKDRKAHFEGKKSSIRIRVPGGQIFEAAVDTSLRRVGTANAVNHPIFDTLAAVLDFCDLGINQN